MVAQTIHIGAVRPAAVTRQLRRMVQRLPGRRVKRPAAWKAGALRAAEPPGGSGSYTAGLISPPQKALGCHGARLKAHSPPIE